MTFGGVAERIGRRFAMWNANRIRGALINNSNRDDGRALVYHSDSDEIRYAAVSMQDHGHEEIGDGLSIKGVLVDDTWIDDGRFLMYHAASDRLVYVDPPAGGSPGVTLDGGSPGTEGSSVIDGGDPGSLHDAIIDCGGVV